MYFLTTAVTWVLKSRNNTVAISNSTEELYPPALAVKAKKSLSVASILKSMFLQHC